MEPKGMLKFPLTDTIIYSLARLVDDAQSSRRDPSHADIGFQAKKAGIQDGDPNREGTPVGKEKRVRAFLSWAIENAPDGAEQFAMGLLSQIKACGGFRDSSQNFVGSEAISNLSSALREVNISLASDGSITPSSLESLSEKEVFSALQLYIQRAKKGIGDSPLVIGTGKDLLEAVAGHVLQKLWGSHSRHDNFPTLLGQAFTALNMATSQTKADTSEHPSRKVERNLFDLACSINTLRNKQGVGHGRPWLPDISENEGKIALESMGIIAEAMLDKLQQKLKA